MGKWLLLLLIVFGLIETLTAQDRYFPHITSNTSEFTTEIILENKTEEMSVYRIVPYTQEGMALPAVLGSVEPGETQKWNWLDLLGSPGAASFVISETWELGDENFSSEHTTFTVVYRLADDAGSPVHIPVNLELSTSWRLFSGNWDLVYDGIAVVNYGNAPTNITITNLDESGQVLTEKVIREGLAPNEKLLVVLGPGNIDFPDQGSNIFEISGDQPLGVIGIQGNLNQSLFLWSSQVTPF